MLMTQLYQRDFEQTSIVLLYKVYKTISKNKYYTIPYNVYGKNCVCVLNGSDCFIKMLFLGFILHIPYTSTTVCMTSYVITRR